MSLSVIGSRMSLTSIAVYVGFDDGADDRVAAAAEISTRFNALLIGVGGWPVRKYGSPALPVEGIFSFKEGETIEEVSKQLALLEQKFRQAAEKLTARIEWRGSYHFPREVVVQEARAADLVVISPETLPGDVYRTYDPGLIIVSAGRPVLVIPHGVSRIDAQRILVAWKDTREARRAVSDALPMLKRAKNVAIAIAHPERTEGVDLQVADLINYLLRHGVTVTEQIATVADEGAGDILLELAREYAADLIICGAYGRTRLSEWIFGGVTRHLLTTSAVPCLFSN